MKKSYTHTHKAGGFPGSGEGFRLPPDISFSRQPWGKSWAYVFRHQRLGELGRILLQGTTGGKTIVCCEVAGDPADPMTAERAAIFKPLGIEISEKMETATGGPVSDDSMGDPLPRPPESSETIATKHMTCDQCGAMTSMLIFAPDATDPGRFEDYARKMYHEYVRLNLPTWIIGPDLGGGPPIDRPADVLKVWPKREPLRRWTAKKFNAMLDRLDAGHCPPGQRQAPRPGNPPAPNRKILARVAEIDSKVCGLLEEDCDDVTILAEMLSDMPEFKRVMDAMLETTGPDGWDDLCERFDGFGYFADLLHSIALGIASGEIEVP
jgi:hypothetical protein